MIKKQEAVLPLTGCDFGTQKRMIKMRISSKEVFDRENVFGQGQANTAFAQYFIGNSYLNPLTEPGKSLVFLANVTFEPGCRNN